jgi:hypothetical protein
LCEAHHIDQNEPSDLPIQRGRRVRKDVGAKQDEGRDQALLARLGPLRIASHRITQIIGVSDWVDR